MPLPGDAAARAAADSTCVRAGETRRLVHAAGLAVAIACASALAVAGNASAAGDAQAPSIGVPAARNAVAGPRHVRARRPPRASTGGARLASRTTARLTASVDPAGLATSARFEFGRSAALGHVTPNRSLGSGTARRALADSITGLRAGGTYYYRVVAVNASGTTIGATRSIVVPARAKGASPALTTDTSATAAAEAPAAAPPAIEPPPVPQVPGAAVAPSVQTGSASGGANGWSVAGTVDPRGVAAIVWAEYGTSTAYGSQTATGTAAAAAP